MSPRLISIILPVHDQAGHVERVVDAYLRALSSLPVPHEVLLVPNGCSDASPAVCEAIARRSPVTRVLRSDRAGWGRAIRMGLRAAEGDVVGYTNSARTTADDLARLAARAIASPSALVAAERTHREGLVRAAGSLLYNLECRALFGFSTRDVNATPKLFPRSFHRLFELTRDDDLLDAELHAVCREEGYPVVAMPVSPSRRHGGVSTTGLRTAIRLYTGAVRLRLDRAR